MNTTNPKDDNPQNPKRALKKFDKLSPKKKKGMLLSKEAERTIGNNRAELQNEIENEEDKIRK